MQSIKRIDNIYTQDIKLFEVNVKKRLVYELPPRPPALDKAFLCSSLICTLGNTRVAVVEADGAGKNPRVTRYDT